MANILEDVRLAPEWKKPVDFYGRVGGNVPTVEELFDYVIADPHVPV